MAQLCRRQAKIACSSVVGCCSADAPKAADRAACEAGLQAACIKQSQREADAIAKAAAAIDAVALSACEAGALAAARACRVASKPDEIETCRANVMAKAAIGQACAPGFGGGRCAKNAGVCFAEPTGVVCKAWGKDGELCSAAPCAPGLLCISNADVTKPAVCGAPRASGAACVTDRHCRSGLACFNNKCGAAIGVGSTCKGSGAKCLPDLMCDPLSSTCQKKRTRGGACYLQAHCAEGLACTEVTTGLVCVPGDPSDGSDKAGLPTLGQRCSDTCAKGLKCAQGPIAGACLPSLCVAVLQALE